MGEKKVNEKFVIDNKIYLTKEDYPQDEPSCGICAFFKTKEVCKILRCIDHIRTDKKNVHFEEIK